MPCETHRSQRRRTVRGVPLAHLRWEWVAGLGASERRFDEVAVRAARSGADLVGYLNYIHPYRVQILGEREIAYHDQRHA